MMTDKTAFIGEKKKLEAFKERFLKATRVVLGRWKNEYELALAMGDASAANKEKIKVDAMKRIQQLCEEASREKTLEGAVRKFGSSTKEIKEVLQQRLEEAKASGKKEKEIDFRIELGIYDGPASGFLKASLKGLGEDASKYQEFINRE